MFAFDFSAFREAVVSAAGAVVFGAMFVAAAVLPAQQAVAAVLHL